MSSRSLPVKTAIQLQRHEEGFWKEEGKENKKNVTDKTNLNQLHSACYPLELTKQQ